jgi:hypothetical protein
VLRIVTKRHRPGLASELLESLFCGLPRLERRMAVFVAAADESDGPRQTGPFVYGGFVGPTLDWKDSFAPAWQERVLNGNPVLPFFHMTEIRNPKWQEKYGIKPWEAERRIDEAVRVVGSMGGIRLARTSFDGGHFRRTFQSARIATHGPQLGGYRLDPDYIGFMGFARGVLEYVHREYPDAEKVDFLIEKKQTVSHYIPNYLDMVEDWLKRNEQHELVELIGEINPRGDKTRVPLQAADLAMWHIRRHEANESEPIDVRRLGQMFDGRTMILSGMTNDEITLVASRIAARMAQEANGGAS